MHVTVNGVRLFFDVASANAPERTLAAIRGFIRPK